MRILKFIFNQHFKSGIIILIAAFMISYAYGAWFDYPRGYDAAFHVFKTDYIIQHWPWHHWWNIWAGGMPLFLYYPPLSHYFLALAHLVTKLSLEFILTFFAVTAMGFSAFAIYLYVFRLTRYKVLAFSSSLIYLTFPDSWSMQLKSGVYMRVFAMPFFIFTLLFAMIYFESFNNANKDKRWFWLASLFYGLTIMMHQFIAAICFFVLFIMVLLIKGGFFVKVRELVKILFFSILVSASFTLPLLYYFPKNTSNTWVSEQAVQTVQVSPLLHLERSLFLLITLIKGASNIKFHPEIYSTVFLFIISGIFIGKLTNFDPENIKLSYLNKLFIKFYRDNEFAIRILFFTSILVGLWIVYGTGSLLSLFKVIPLFASAYAFLGTRGAAYFVPLFSSISIGILVYLVLPNKRWLIYVFSIFFFLLNAIYLKEEYQSRRRAFIANGESVSIQKRDFSSRYDSFTETIMEQNQGNHRFAVQSIKVADPLLFNMRFPDIPQTGHYFSSGVANFEMYYYAMDILWKSNNPEVTRNILDWWAIKNIITGSSDAKFNSIDFIEISSNEGVGIFQYPISSPILFPTNSPVLLNIGSRSAYRNALFRALGLANYDTGALIPIQGGMRIDEYLTYDLQPFDMIFLYDYQLNSLAGAAGVLNDYVINGGNLIIESNRSVEEDASLPDPYPIQSIKVSKREGVWDFKLAASNSFLSKSNFSSFSPAMIDNQPWNISEGIGVKNWAKVLVYSKEKPVIVEGNLGKGKVLWSGINLPFHIVDSKNNQEVQVFRSLISEYIPTPKQDNVNYQSQFINPQLRKISITGSVKGVLFKENLFPNWKASVKTKKREYHLNLLSAGPGFMYTFLPEDSEEVTFAYRRSILEWFSDIISLMSFSWVAYILFILSIRKRQK